MIDCNPFASPKSSESTSIKHLLYWVWEREAIRIAKDNKHQGDLTEDSIFKQYRFCNVRRRDDRVSKWIIENMLVHAEPDEDDIWFISAIARFVNWPPTLFKLLSEGAILSKAQDFDSKLFCNIIDGIATDEGKVWTGAYMVRADGKYPTKSGAVAEYLMSSVNSRENIRSAVKSKSVENIITEISNCHGFGTFMSGQIAADLSYVYDLKDQNTWAPMGPGSQRGLNRLCKKPLKQTWKQDEFNETLIAVKNEIHEKLDITDLTLHDVQNVMCEMDKYWRVLYGEGRPRATYKPETAF